WMPSTTHPNLIGKSIIGKTESVTVGTNNMFLQVIKQRGGLPKGKKWELAWNFDAGVLTSIAQVGQYER
ncbi:MAG: hypothetical protein DSY80_02505, partial [Desulfocapsa sp.]